MSEIQPFTLWSELAQSESFSNTWPQKTGAVFADQGKECGNFEPRGISGEEVWVLQEGRQHQSSPEETKDSETSEKGTERDVVGCQAQEKCPF